MTETTERERQLLRKVKELQQELAEQSIRKNEILYKTLFDSATDGNLLFDNNHLVDCNSAALSLFACKREQMIGASPWSFSPPTQSDGRDSEEAAQERINAILAGEPQIFLWQHTRFDGTLFDAEVRLNQIEVEDTSLFLAVVRDITEQKQAQEKLAKSEAHQALVLRSLPMAFYTASPFGDYGGTWVSEQIEQITGFPPKSFIEDPNFWASRLHPEDRSRALSEYEAISKTGSVQLEYRWQIADGNFRWFQDHGVLVLDEQGRPNEVIGTWMDISKRKNSEQELKASRVQLRALAAELTLAEERERRRFATYLHDHIGQSLALLRMRFGALAAEVESSGSYETIQSIRVLLQETIDNTRSLTLDLSPPILYELGLGPALEWIGEKICADNELIFSFHDDSSARELSDESIALLFRSVRELLMNVVKHASAHSVEISVSCSANELLISVIDDGVGLSPTVGGCTPRFGLFSIREGLGRIRGCLDLKSEVNQGTRAIITMPLLDNNK